MIKRIGRTQSKRTKPPYRPGTLGPSAVSQDIRRDYGAILSRRVRRKERDHGIPFKPYYNNVR